MDNGVTYKQQYSDLIKKIKDEIKNREVSCDNAKKLLDDINISNYSTIVYGELKRVIEQNENIIDALMDLL